MNSYIQIEYDDEDHQFIRLPHIYSEFKDTFIYYQVIDKKNDSYSINYEFRFHFHKDEAKDSKPILMSRIDKKGRLGCPADLMRVSVLHKDKLFLIENGITDFTITTKVPENGIASSDDAYLRKLFKKQSNKYQEEYKK